MSTSLENMQYKYSSFTDDIFGRRNMLITYGLWLFFGFLGFHKFYLNKPIMGLLYIVTGGLFFVGWFIDLFTIPTQVDRANGDMLYKMSSDTAPVPNYIVPNKKPSEKDKERLVLHIAKKNGGLVTPVEIAADSNLSIEEIETILNKFSKKGYVDFKITDNGTVLYEFTGLLSEEAKRKSTSIQDYRG